LSSSKKIFICPLDWGLGHATRCIPIIREFRKRDHEVVIGGTGKSLELLREEFPCLKTIILPGYRMRYAGRHFLFLALLLQMPLFLFSIIKEHYLLKKIQKKEKFDLIISDNRYGLFQTYCLTVFISHQLNIILPSWLRLFQGISRRAIRYFINQFDICWVPDSPGENNLSGNLSHQSRKYLNDRYVGILSRFVKQPVNLSQEEDFDIVAIVSGPEPSRKKFEEILREQMISTGQKSLLIRGVPGADKVSTKDAFTEVSHMNSRKFAGIIKNSKYVICRSGYSGVMDMVALGKTALLVPTPGQTEQEYLSQYLDQIELFPSMKQGNFNLQEALTKLDCFSSNFSGWVDPESLSMAIDEVLSSCKNYQS
jgi:uncharacterized protein (TIGR00661 family)